MKKIIKVRSMALFAVAIGFLGMNSLSAFDLGLSPSKETKKHGELITLSNGVKIYTESYGNEKNPTILFNAGAGNDCITWDKEGIIRPLVKQGYRVIRYDTRDAGLSDGFAPGSYNVTNLADDSIGILDHYKVKKATFVGFSMGGMISQFAASKNADRVENLVLIATSCDFAAIAQRPAKYTDTNGAPLPGPNLEYMTWAASQGDVNQMTPEQKINYYQENWFRLSGSPEIFDKSFFEKQGKTYFERLGSKPFPFMNHAFAMALSVDALYTVIDNETIKQPALVLYGEKDQLFPPHHGEVLASKLGGTALKLDGFGHCISPEYFDDIVKNITSFLKNKESDSSSNSSDEEKSNVS